MRSLLSALAQSPNDPALENNLAVHYFALGRFEEALRSSRRSVDLDGSVKATRLNLAIIYGRLNRLEEARQEASNAAALDRRDARARSFSCELDLWTARFQESVSCYQDLFRDFEPTTEFRVRYGVSLIGAKRFAEAEGVLSSLLRENPNDVNILSALANLHFADKQFAKSSEYLRRAVELDPDSAQLRYNLAISYLAAKNRPAAISQYKLINESDAKLATSLYKTLFGRYIIDASGR